MRKVNSYLTSEQLTELLRKMNPSCKLKMVYTNNPDEYLTSNIPPEKLNLPEGFRYSPRWGVTNLPVGYNPERHSGTVTYTEPVIHTSLRVVYNG